MLSVPERRLWDYDRKEELFCTHTRVSFKREDFVV
jgi:hypothetical protein